jgi:hypothetical protein
VDSNKSKEFGRFDSTINLNLYVNVRMIPFGGRIILLG